MMRRRTAGLSLVLLVAGGCYADLPVSDSTVAESQRRQDSSAEFYSGIKRHYDKDTNRTRVWFDDRRVETRPGLSKGVSVGFRFSAEFPGQEPVHDVQYGLALTVDARKKVLLTRADNLILMLNSSRLLLAATDYQILLTQQGHTKEGLGFALTRADLVRIVAARDISGQIGGSMRFAFGPAQRRAIDELLREVPERPRSAEKAKPVMAAASVSQTASAVSSDAAPVKVGPLTLTFRGTRRGAGAELCHFTYEAGSDGALEAASLEAFAVDDKGMVVGQCSRTVTALTPGSPRLVDFTFDRPCAEITSARIQLSE